MSQPTASHSLNLNYTLADCVGARAATQPHRVAIEVLDPRTSGTTPVETWTYDQVWRRVMGLAAVLGDVAPGANGPMAAILAPNGVDHALAYLACQVAGVAAVPVNSRLAAAEVDFVLSDSGASVLLVAGEHLALGTQVATARGCRVIDMAAVPTPAVAPWAGPSGVEAARRVAVVAYTSGTTGFPKGTTSRNQDWLARTAQWGWTFGLGPHQVLSTPGPLFHLSYGGLTLGALAIGAKVRLMTAFDPAVALEEYSRHSTWVFLVPSMLAMVAEVWKASGRPPAEALDVLLSSGAPGPLSLLEEAFDIFPRARITEAYGWTEGGWVTYEVKERGNVTAHSVGWPMIESEVRVLGADGAVAAVGEAGEVVARTSVPFGGYLNRPDATAEALTPDGFTRSGDVGIRLADGRLTIVDRVKDRIITGGENVYCAEVERVLHEHPDVVEAAVVGLADPTWGELVTAVVVGRAGVTLDPAEVVAFTRANLAHYKCPRRVLVQDALPRNPMGKVQKFRLVEQLTAS